MAWLDVGCWDERKETVPSKLDGPTLCSAFNTLGNMLAIFYPNFLKIVGKKAIPNNGPHAKIPDTQEKVLT